MTPGIEQIRARLEALKTGWTSVAQWQQMSLDFRRHIIEDETALLAAIDDLTARNAKLEAVAKLALEQPRSCPRSHYGIVAPCTGCQALWDALDALDD